MELKFCKFCGEKIPKDQIICTKCGRQLEIVRKNKKEEEKEETTTELESNTCIDYKNLGLIISLVLFPPLGIAYLWSSFPKIKNSLKVALTIFFGLTFFAIIFNFVSQIEENQESTSKTTYRYTTASTSKTTTTKDTSTTTKSASSQSTTRQTERTTTKGATTTTQATKNESVSVSKLQAVKKAKSYLGAMSFSYKGLIEQLEYEGFSNEDAKYGADNCGANWNTQAVKKAKSYLNATSFSYKGLVEQLEYEKFTSAQAKYGVDNCGADWYKQAEKKAASYMKVSSFSRKSLIEQLEYEGFTADQAKHGADSVGL